MLTPTTTFDGITTVHGITTYKDAINRSLIRRGYDLALP